MKHSFYGFHCMETLVILCGSSRGLHWNSAVGRCFSRQPWASPDRTSIAINHHFAFARASLEPSELVIGRALYVHGPKIMCVFCLLRQAHRAICSNAGLFQAAYGPIDPNDPILCLQDVNASASALRHRNSAPVLAASQVRNRGITCYSLFVVT